MENDVLYDTLKEILSETGVRGKYDLMRAALTTGKYEFFKVFCTPALELAKMPPDCINSFIPALLLDLMDSYECTLEIVKFLFGNYIFNIDSYDTDGNSLLKKAFGFCNVDVATFLFVHGASTKISGHNGFYSYVLTYSPEELGVMEKLKYMHLINIPIDYQDAMVKAIFRRGGADYLDVIRWLMGTTDREQYKENEEKWLFEVVQSIVHDEEDDDRSVEEWIEILKVMIECGVNPNPTVEFYGEEMDILKYISIFRTERIDKIKDIINS